LRRRFRVPASAVTAGATYPKGDSSVCRLVSRSARDLARLRTDVCFGRLRQPARVRPPATRHPTEIGSTQQGCAAPLQTPPWRHFGFEVLRRPSFHRPVRCSLLRMKVFEGVPRGTSSSTSLLNSLVVGDPLPGSGTGQAPSLRAVHFKCNGAGRPHVGGLARPTIRVAHCRRDSKNSATRRLARRLGTVQRMLLDRVRAAKRRGLLILHRTPSVPRGTFDRTRRMPTPPRCRLSRGHGIEKSDGLSAIQCPPEVARKIRKAHMRQTERQFMVYNQLNARSPIQRSRVRSLCAPALPLRSRPRLRPRTGTHAHQAEAGS
jgi:hypothetical protein